jgi:hypothetical protein
MMMFMVLVTGWFQDVKRITRAAILSTLSKASGEASSSGMEILYLTSRKRFSDTMENESTRPLEINGLA